MKKPKTHNDRIVDILKKTQNISSTALSKRANIPLSSVYKRVHELITEYQVPIQKEYRQVKGKRRVFYTLNSPAATEGGAMVAA